MLYLPKRLGRGGMVTCGEEWSIWWMLSTWSATSGRWEKVKCSSKHLNRWDITRNFNAFFKQIGDENKRTYALESSARNCNRWILPSPLIHIWLFFTWIKLFLLEELRDRKFDGYARKIQKAYRMYKSRQYFAELKQQGNLSSVPLDIPSDCAGLACVLSFLHICSIWRAWLSFLPDVVCQAVSSPSNLLCAVVSASDILFNKKERRRFSINRNFVGDYIGYDNNPALRSLVGMSCLWLSSDFVSWIALCVFFAS